MLNQVEFVVHLTLSWEYREQGSAARDLRLFAPG